MGRHEGGYDGIEDDKDRVGKSPTKTQKEPKRPNRQQKQAKEPKL